MSVLRRIGLSFAALSILSAAPVAAAPDKPAESEPFIARGKSGLPLPRFVSLKSGRVNSRIGPGVTYAVDWLYLKAGLPVEIVQEFDNWRKIRDSDGSEGWINQSLLSSRRMALVTPWQKGKKTQISVLEEPDKAARTVAYVEPGVLGQISSCDGNWCEVTFDGHTGWMAQNLLWGAYPGESVAE